MQKTRTIKKNRNNICVIGLGRFGFAVVSELIEQDIPVLVIDSDEKRLARFSNYPSVTTIVADASDPKILESLGINEIETIIVAISNNIDIIAILLELNIENIIARSSSSSHARILRQIGVDYIVRPEYESGTRTALIATNINFIKFSKSLTELGDGFVIGSTQILNNNYVGIELKNMHLNKLGLTLVLYKRDNQTHLPSANAKFQIGDELVVVGKIRDVTNFFGVLNSSLNQDEAKIGSRKRRRRF